MPVRDKRETATAIIVATESVAHPYAFLIQDGPDAGGHYSDRSLWWRAGETVTVEFNPQDQFAAIKE